MKIVSVFVLVQSTCLIGFSAARLSEAELSIGQGANSDKYIMQCSHGNGFME
jgi:hypothetical protein